MSRRDDVLAALRVDGPVSGETLARRLGVSRAAVAKHVNALRDLGYVIDAEAGSGYWLREVPDALIPEEVAARLMSDRWGPVTGSGETGSTNEDCKRLAREGAPDGTVVIASRQTAGRGRLGRVWDSPEGGVYLSALVRPALLPAQAPPMALSVALGIVEGLGALGIDAGVKWPNDVWTSDGGKLAGVLVEMSAETDRVEWIVVGVGLNVARPKNPTEGAAYSSDLRPGTTPTEVAAAVLDGMSRAIARFEAEGFAALREAYERVLVIARADVKVSDMHGRVVAVGKVVGVDDFGRLLVERDGETLRVAAGEVTLRDDSDRRRP